ncbi:MAG TPA: metal ABC transporter permease [Candidatus Thiothrix moscowensis]|uniref:metal ABC transporter permease n=1 Tax=unclassified Thiothrix TaxID=2636184 RepID=UPI0025F186D6|nr:MULTISPECIES: metal ABC transporter permease [unclassified Thiothrix]HRJ52540.1 metal ABC transporter permease [Candidatus Thiothrix moscowensis]HRJ94316.1 metal ABC transporter permease [Candidatus Thiothrix moscowensis]
MLYDLLFAPFADYVFMQRALVGTWAMALGATPFGVFLLLRRMSLVGDAMAHAILPGIAVGYLLAGLSLTAMTLGGLVVGMVVAVLTSMVTRLTRLPEDASLAAFYLVSLALGVLIISSKGSSVDLVHVLFGSVLALNNAALLLVASIATLSMLTLAVLYRPLVLECFDSAYCRSVSTFGVWTPVVFLVMVVLNLVGGFHALGTLMAVGIMILPAVVARLWTQQLGTMLALAVTVAMLCSWLGLLMSFHFDLPSGPTIILSLGGMYILSALFALRPQRGKVDSVRQFLQ